MAAGLAVHVFHRDVVGFHFDHPEDDRKVKTTWADRSRVEDDEVARQEAMVSEAPAPKRGVRAEVAIDEYETALLPNVRRLARLREELAAALDAQPGLRVYPSRANFLLVELADAEPKAVFEALYAEGILVRDVTSYPRLGRCLRVSVGSEEENARLVAAMPAALRAGTAVGRV